MKYTIVISKKYDAHFNQAVEAALLKRALCGEVILYLWANDNAVFIGKHQNAFLECDLDKLKQNGGVAARRITGGGAVYHDKGNLNYSFIAPSIAYDEQKHFSVIVTALNGLGLDVELSGRNDMTLNGKKFSGNAFLRGKDVSLHHGTLLIKSDYEKIETYLTASKIKLKSKGVSSVASRVINLSEIKENLTKEAVIEAINAAFVKIYGVFSEVLYSCEEGTVDADEFGKWYKKFSDESWQLGDNVDFDVKTEHRFDWGIADIRMRLEGDKIIEARIYSDALDVDLVKEKERVLAGKNISDAVEVLK